MSLPTWGDWLARPSPKHDAADTAEFCELCGEVIPQEDVNVEAFEVSGLLICTECLEVELETAVNPGATVALVGAGR